MDVKGKSEKEKKRKKGQEGNRKISRAEKMKRGKK